MRIIFAGTSEFAVPSLTSLLNSDYEISAVYTRPDRPAGRGKKINQSPVKQVSVVNQLPLFQPENFDNEIIHIKRHSPDVIIVIAYGVIIPDAILTIPKQGCINVHASLLPRWRGAAPIHRAVEAGDKTTGVTLMQMDAGLDTGHILFQSRTPICQNETTGSLHNRLAEIGANLLITHLPAILSGTAPSIIQSEKAANYAHKITKSECWLDWEQSTEQIARKIRAFNPKPTARTTLGKQVILIQEASIGAIIKDGLPGTIINTKKGSIQVKTGNGSLNLNKVQLPGSRPLASSEFLHGFPLKQGQRFQ